MKNALSSILLFCFVLSACGNSSSTYIIPTQTSPVTTTDFNLLNREVNSNWECTFDVEIQEEISEDDLKLLAKYLQYTEGLGCSSLYIYFFLPGDEPGLDMAWAYSFFNPELEIGINGLDVESKATLENINTIIDDYYIGSWIDTGVLSHKIVITKTDNTYEMQSIYSDGSSETIKLFMEIVNNEERLYKNPDNYYGDYMVIKENGYLAFYDNIGFIYELPPE